MISGCSMPKIVILHDPLTPEEHLQLGISYEKKGLFEEAKRHYEEASKKDVRGLLFLGNLYLNIGEYDRAEELYRETIKRDDKISDAYNNLAWLYYLKAEKIDEAENLIRKAMEIEKDNPEKLKTFQDTFEKIQKLKTK
jgi:tetratricopeptide (TPR) repeat protein